MISEINQLPGVRVAKKKSKHSLEPMPEHPGPRGSESNKDLPDFWRRNYDYGESPYMNLESIDKITDKPPYKKKRKKSEMMRDLIKLANILDESGLYTEANKIDSLLNASSGKISYER